MSPLTNGTATPQSFYRIKFDGLPHEVYEYGTDALTAISTARTDLNASGSAIARPAVYKEWNYGTERYTNGGNFIR